MPEFSKRTNRILALRLILRAGIARKDIEAVLPAIRRLRDSEKAMHAAAEKLLDDQERVLLAADPANVPPDDVSAELRSELDKYHKAEQECQASIVASIGRQKEGTFAVLAGWRTPPALTWTQPGKGQSSGGFGAPPSLTKPSTGGKPVAPSGAGVGGSNPFESSGQVSDGGSGSARSTDGGFTTGFQGRVSSPFSGQGGFGGGSQGGVAISPHDPFTGYGFGGFSFGVHLTLTELIDLLEQKLAATRK
jgi:hypothetical protein